MFGRSRPGGGRSNAGFRHGRFHWALLDGNALALMADTSRQTLAFRRTFWTGLWLGIGTRPLGVRGLDVLLELAAGLCPGVHHYDDEKSGYLKQWVACCFGPDYVGPDVWVTVLTPLP